MKTITVKWNWDNPSIEGNNGHNQSEWGLPPKKKNLKKFSS